MKTRSLLLVLVIVASLLSFAKFSQCQSHQWQTPDQFVHACYSDIPNLFTERSLDKGVWSYSNGDQSVEYPVITGAVMWLIAKVTPQNEFRAGLYFNLNVLLLALIFILCALLMYRITPQYAYLSVLSPAVIASLYINWDLWGIITMIAAIYLFDKQKYLYSSIALGVSIATKFMPVFLLVPVILIFWRRNKLRLGAEYILFTAISWFVINLPVILSTPQGWFRFYKLNLNRGPEWGSPWYALNLLGVNIKGLNIITLLGLLVAFIILTIYILEVFESPTLASVAYIVLATVMILSKVYSPQYVLWLTPLAVMALSNAKDLIAFWIWQGAEIIYHFAIWLYLATLSGANFEFSGNWYAVITLIRIAASGLLICVFIRRGIGSMHKSERDFHLTR